MIEIIKLAEPPPLPDAPADKTVEFYSIGYGPFNDLTSHTPLLYVGVVPLSLLGTRAYLWAFLTEEGQRASISTLRAARRTADEFFNQAPWDFAAFCEQELKKNARFLRWLGFRHTTTEDGFHFFWRPKCR